MNEKANEPPAINVDDLERVIKLGLVLLGEPHVLLLRSIMTGVSFR